MVGFVYGFKEGDGVEKGEEVQSWLKAGRKRTSRNVLKDVKKEAMVISTMGEASLVLT